MPDSDMIVCEADHLGCDFVGNVNEYLPNLTSMHNDIRCPKCGSTKNAHNRAYSEKISARMRASFEKSSECWCHCGAREARDEGDLLPAAAGQQARQEADGAQQGGAGHAPSHGPPGGA